MKKYKWKYQYLETLWTMWGVGFTFANKRGWEPDELVIFIGPLRFYFASNVKYDEE